MNVAGRSLRRQGACLAIALAVLAVSACEPRAVVRSVAARYRVMTLTPEGTDRFDVTSADGTIRGTAPGTNKGQNLRIAGVDPTLGTSTNQQVCVTWTETRTTAIQPGVALRVRTAGGVTRSIIVTNNIVYGARWFFNVHLTRSRGEPNVELMGSLQIYWERDDLPWRICGRAVGTRILVKAWPLSTHPEEPSWSDPAYAGSVRVPAEWVYPGRPGWYMGHLQAGEQMAYTDAELALLPRTFGATTPTPRTEPDLGGHVQPRKTTAMSPG